MPRLDHDSGSSPISCVLFESSSTAPSRTWLTPRVAMNELTCRRTMMKPDTNPQNAETASAISALASVGIPVWIDR